jgi:acetyl esterase/lipase
MTAADLNPALPRALSRFPRPAIASTFSRALTRRLITIAPGQKIPAGIETRRISLGDGAGVRVYLPHGRAEGADRAALLWIHGGGMVIGDASIDHGRCAKLASELGIVVVSVNYRLAPEHPFPAPLDDCRRAWSWLLEQAAELRIDPRRIAIGGQSAGGGLAAGLVQRIHDEGGTQPAAQWLFCPMLDDRTAADRRLDARRHFVWDNERNRIGWSAYLGEAPGGDAVSSYAAPSRRADLSGLPPAWIGVGDIELFYDENRRYAETLTAAGVATVLAAIPGAPHGIDAIGRNLPVVREFLAGAADWLAKQLTGTPRSEFS